MILTIKKRSKRSIPMSIKVTPETKKGIDELKQYYECSINDLIEEVVKEIQEEIYKHQNSNKDQQ